VKVGITGHQDLGSDVTVGWVRSALSDAVRQYSVTEGLTCLAAGTDQLYAEILRQNNIPYTSVIPSHNYEKTFEVKSHCANYRTLLAHAQNTITLDFAEPGETAFFEAGKEVVNMSAVVFAVWNGQEAKGLGGTADIVKYALDNNKKVVHFNPVSRAVEEL